MASAFDLDGVLAKCWEGKLLSLGELLQLCVAAREVLENDENCVQVSAPVIVVGDIHGQFYDLLELFKVCGAPPLNNFLVLGDYVDRGRHSVETICLLLALKVKHPLRMTLLRGNHETRAITKVPCLLLQRCLSSHCALRCMGFARKRGASTACPTRRGRS
jgi:serine/threonine-protein phosphatase 2A catalytic subunit